MSLATMIESRLRAYLSREASLQEFEDWFVPSTWDVRNRQGETVRQLAYAIELRLAEYTAGHLTESELQHELRQLISNAPSEPLQPTAAQKTGPK